MLRLVVVIESKAFEKLGMEEILGQKVDAIKKEGQWTIIYLREIERTEGLKYSRRIYCLPIELRELSGTRLQIECAECGGFDGKDGRAQIVCGVQGQSLRPLFLPRNPTPRENAAIFRFSKSFCTISLKTDEDGIELNDAGIYLHSIRQQTDEYPNSVWIRSERKWEGVYASSPSMPNTLMGRFYVAMINAAEKARCRDCTHIHYGQKGKRKQKKQEKKVPGWQDHFGPPRQGRRRR